jgi:hypothetical protein
MTFSPERIAEEARLRAIRDALVTELRKHQLNGLLDDRQFRAFVTGIDRGLQLARMQRPGTMLDAG